MYKQPYYSNKHETTGYYIYWRQYFQTCDVSPTRYARVNGDRDNNNNNIIKYTYLTGI